MKSFIILLLTLFSLSFGLQAATQTASMTSPVQKEIKVLTLKKEKKAKSNKSRSIWFAISTGFSLGAILLSLMTPVNLPLVIGGAAAGILFLIIGLATPKDKKE